MFARWATCGSALIAVLGALGCSASDNGPGTQTCTPGTVGCPVVGSGGTTSSFGGGSGNGSVQQPGGLGSGGNGVVGPVGGTAGSGMQPVSAMGVPCNIASIVSARCTGCHQSPTKYGAPMPLMSIADFQAQAKSDATKKVYEVIPTRLNSTDTNKVMPPISQPMMPAADKMTLTMWLTGGAMPSATSCPITAGDANQTGTAGAGAAGTGAAGMGAPSTRSGGASIEPQEYNDPNMTCYKFLSHAAGQPITTPYMQPPGEVYSDFTFAAPWKTTVYQRATKIVLDTNSRVIHHWLLFKMTGQGTDTVIPNGNPTHPDMILLHGWAPGASPLYLDPDVGVQLEASNGIELEVHFNNSTGAPGPDNSGAEVCVTTTKPEHLAELAWVGTDSIAGTSATGSCRPNGPFPIHLIAAQPHMHKTGTHMKETVIRANGMKEVIHDHDFSFDDQRYYILNTTLMQGDSMQTDCSYSTFASFGSSTSQEMCYFFSLHWPAGSLRAAGVGTVLHGQDSCL